MTSIICEYLPSVRYTVKTLARLAFAEDLPGGDVTAAALDLRGRPASARLITREAVPMCGEVIFDLILEAYRARVPEAAIEARCLLADGEPAAAGTTLLELSGDVASIVGTERVLLNFLGRGIGIARKTRELVEEARRHNDHTRILDTRKTLPGFRYFDKYAVLCGGGHNHRLNLSDQVLIKENHLARFGSVVEAVAHVRDRVGDQVGIQVEVCNLDQLHQAIEARCPLIMLDNFTPAQVHEACELERGDCLLEVSGGIDRDNLTRYLHPRLDRISIGALTHSVKAPDLSLLISEEPI